MKLSFSDIVKRGYTEEIFIDEEQLQQIFADGLKRIRKYKNLSLRQVEKETGITHSLILKYEKNKSSPSIIQAFKLSSFYKISIENIFLIGYYDEFDAEEEIKEITERQKKNEEILNRRKNDKK